MNMKLVKIETTNARVEELKTVAAELSGLGVIAGGAVLDAILDRDHKDIDLFYPEQMMQVKQFFVQRAEQNGTGFSTVGGGAYTVTAFAESGAIDMLGKTYQIELIQKDTRRLLSTIISSLIQNGDYNKIRSAYDVKGALETFLLGQEDLMKSALLASDNPAMLSVYGRLLVHEFDLDIKQIMIDPVTLDVMATEAFVEAFSNQTVGFSRILIHGEGVTRRNLVRIADASMKYGLTYQDQETVSQMIDAMVGFHTTFPSSTGDATLVKRFFNTSGKRFLVPSTIEEECVHIPEMMTTKPLFSPEASDYEKTAIRKLDYREIAVQMFDPWVRSVFIKNGQRQTLNFIHASFYMTLAEHTEWMFRCSENFKGNRLQDFIKILWQSRDALNFGPRLIKPIDHNIETDKVNGLSVREDYVGFDKFAPCTTFFVELSEALGVTKAIQVVSETIVTTPKGHRSYSLSSDDEKQLKAELYAGVTYPHTSTKTKDAYRFEEYIERKVNMFELFQGDLSFDSLEDFESARLFVCGLNREGTVRTTLEFEGKFLFAGAPMPYPIPRELLMTSPEDIGAPVALPLPIPEVELNEDDMPW